jgi:hypothetical protein
MELDKIKKQTTWNDASANINSNFAKLQKGFSEIANATYKNKGYFTTLEALLEAYPSSFVGSRAYVGTSYPYEIYLWSNDENTWVNSGEFGGEESVNLGNYYTKEETASLIENYHVVLSQKEYDALEEKEDKLYFIYEDE